MWTGVLRVVPGFAGSAKCAFQSQNIYEQIKYKKCNQFQLFYLKLNIIQFIFMLKFV